MHIYLTNLSKLSKYCICIYICTIYNINSFEYLKNNTDFAKNFIDFTNPILQSFYQNANIIL